MKNIVYLSGSISKKEVLIPLQSNILKNTFVAEAAYPYANYYGRVPLKPKPNSLFLLTKKFYFLEEILSSAQNIEHCLLENINIAASFIEFNKKQFPAIRIKNFPNYDQLASLQSCLVEFGIEFAPQIRIEGEIRARINKLFELKELETDFYMDTIEENKGYFIHHGKLSPEAFEDTVSKIRNNGTCKLFDAVQGEILKDGKVYEFVRIFAEGLDISLLKCVRNQFEKLLSASFKVRKPKE
jgi:hypothetical protein